MLKEHFDEPMDYEAAPDLLKACVVALASMPVRYDYEIIAKDQLRAAISKAKP